MDAKLNGLNIQPKASLTSPDQLMQKAQASQPVVPAQQFENLPTQDPTTTSANPSQLSVNDKLDKSSILSSGIAGGIGAATIARDMGTIGESMRSVNVQNSMTELQNRSYNSDYNSYNSSYGNDYSYNNNNYNNYNNSYNNNYNNDYAATEFVRRRGYGSIEYRNGRARIEGGGMSSPEMQLGAKTLAGGALQGAKYGGIIGGAVSSVVNAYKVITGQEKGADAVGSVAADTVTATISGAGGAVTGGLATMGLGLIGIGGIPGIVVGVGLGAVGAIGSQLLMQKTGLYDSLKQKVSGMLSK